MTHRELQILLWNGNPDGLLEKVNVDSPLYYVSVLLWDDELTEEEVNLLYVAATRAIDRLELNGSLKWLMDSADIADKKVQNS